MTIERNSRERIKADASFQTERVPGSRIDIGLVGFGNIGVVHGDVLTRPTQQSFRLVGVADPYPRMEPPNQEIKLYRSLEELLREPSIEAISITTPPDSHYDLVMQALKSGKHVAVEKPPALTLEDLNLMKNAAQDRNLTFFTAFHARYGASVTEAREILKGQKIKAVKVFYSENVGDYHDIENGWVLKKDRNGGGVFMDSGINALSVVASIIPDQFINPHVTVAHLSKPEGYVNPKTGRVVNFETETRAEVQFKFGENGKGEIQQEWLADTPAKRTVEFITEGDDVYEVDIIHKTVKRNGLIIFDANASELTKVDRVGEYTGVYDNFAQSIISGVSFVESNALELVRGAYDMSPTITTVPIDTYHSLK